ncbi:MAG: hypothetical protein D6722_14060 [Bacteroidetes bacterium]|nr:MAG: hypothetical protein D6722_14060 [Bacteroidota bacterium]
MLWIILAACQDNPPANTPGIQAAATPLESPRLEILDFHTAHRCRSCLAIEKLTRETLSTYFAEEQEAGTIVFRLINADAPENAALAERFGAFGTTLILNLEAGPHSEIRDVTEFAFKRAWDREQFQTELKAMIEALLAQGDLQG